jgi:hypothetical protein
MTSKGRTQFRASVAENARVGTTVLTTRVAEADDTVMRHDDAGDNTVAQRRSRASNSSRWISNNVVYSLALDADVEGRFAVDKKTGEIRITRLAVGSVIVSSSLRLACASERNKPNVKSLVHGILIV